jgi:phospholipase C
MADINRRHLLQGAAATAALALGKPPSALSQVLPAAKLSDIDHIIVMMKENRSFDHYFGSLHGVRGFDDPNAHTLPNGRSVFHQPDPNHGQGFVLPFHLDTLKTNAQSLVDLDHSWHALHAAWNGGKMDKWIPELRKQDGDSAPMTMGYHTRADLPYYYALADAFTICDGYHASMMGPTHPNRFFWMTATNDPDGKHGGPSLKNGGRTYTWESYPQRLQKAGITWRVYQVAAGPLNILRNLVQFQNLRPSSELYEAALKERSFNQLLTDLKTGNIPQVTWIMPHSGTSEHPSSWPAAGEDHTSQILAALWSNEKLWAKTAFVLNYDENDGQFDHVVPPTPEPGTKGEFVGGLPNGLGYRVPCMVISPFSRGGHVCGETFDHTSVLRLMEARFGVEVSNLSAWRRKTCGDLTKAFGFGQPADYSIPTMPDAAATLALAKKNVDSMPDPVVPEVQAMPKQEAGTRSRRV